jgi:hypothetical protein
MWAVLERDGQLMSEQETLLYPEVMMMTKRKTRWAGDVVRRWNDECIYDFSPKT